MGHRGKPPDVCLVLQQSIKRASVKSRMKSQELEINSAPFYSQRHLQLNKRWKHHQSQKKQSWNPLSLFVILVQTKSLGGTLKSRTLAEECSALGVCYKSARVWGDFPSVSFSKVLQIPFRELLPKALFSNNQYLTYGIVLSQEVCSKQHPLRVNTTEILLSNYPAKKLLILNAKDCKHFLK